VIHQPRCHWPKLPETRELEKVNAMQVRAGKVRELYASFGQGHVLKFFDNLTQPDQVQPIPLVLTHVLPLADM